MASAPSVRHDRPYSVRQLRRASADAVTGELDYGCVFSARCPFAVTACETRPQLETIGDRWDVACHRHAEWPELAHRS